MTLSTAQKRARKRGVGCSQALAALGKDPRCTRLELYQRKVGELPHDVDLSENERVLFGELIEPVLRKEAGRRMGQQIMKPRQTLYHESVPLLGHLDGWIPTLKEGAEFKNVDKFEAEDYGEEGTDQVPIRHLVQCAGYMALTNAERWHLGVLIGGNDFRLYVIQRDRQLEDALLTGVTEFWSHVERRDPPDPQTPEDVRLRWPKDLGTTIEATDAIVESCQLLADTKAKLKVLEEAEKSLKKDVQLYMRDAADLVDAHGKLVATWRSAKPSMKFDEDRFAVDWPEQYKQYQEEVPGTRRFLVKLKAEQGETE